MSNIRNRVLALSMSVFTAFTTVAGSVPAYAADPVVPEAVTDTAEETVVINVKLDGEGGTVTAGSDEQALTAEMSEDGKVIVTGADGSQNEAYVSDDNPYAITLTVEKGASVPVRAEAADGYDVSTYSVTFDGGSDEVPFEKGDTFEYSVAADGDRTVEVGFEKESVPADAEVEEETDSETAEATISDPVRLLVGTDDASVVEGDADKILSSYDGVYLIQYASSEEAEEAKERYEESADFAETDDASLSAADITDVTDASSITEDANPLAELREADPSSAEKGTIALIDTGVSGKDVESVSMLGEDASDDNGHGTKMADFILSEDPDAKILSIKALDANGNGTPSSVYAAIEYAVEKKVSIINLSLSGIKTEENSAVLAAIADAVNAGITVVGAAGNQGVNAKYTIPGCAEDAIIAGSCDENGKTHSNTGDTVDFYVVSDSTSEAAAKLSGYISKNGVPEKADNVLLFKEEQTSSESRNIIGLEMTEEETKAYIAERERLEKEDGMLPHSDTISAAAVSAPDNVPRSFSGTAYLNSSGSIEAFNTSSWTGVPDGITPGTEGGSRRAYCISSGAAYPGEYGDARKYDYEATLRSFDESTGKAVYYVYMTDSNLDCGWDDYGNGHYVPHNGFQRCEMEAYGYFEVKGHAGIHKTDSTTGAALSGASFNIYDEDAVIWDAEHTKVYIKDGAKPVRTTGLTDKNGNTEFVLPDASKQYFAQEVRVPDGYDAPKCTIPGHTDQNFVFGLRVIYQSKAFTAGNYNGNGYITITNTPSNGFVIVRKTSANPSITDGNSCYGPLSDAVFTLTSGSNRYTLPVKRQADGTYATDAASVRPGTYTVEETSVPKGYAKAPNQTVTVRSSNKSGNPAEITVSDTPLADPIGVLLKKIDAETGEDVRRVG